jgi:ribosome-associated toxin RatA of RatAB toxin-antitoxin module
VNLAGKKIKTPSEKEDESMSELDLDIDYDCSSLTLDQSMKQVFNIINSVKIPLIEKQ